MVFVPALVVALRTGPAVAAVPLSTPASSAASILLQSIQSSAITTRGEIVGRIVKRWAELSSMPGTVFIKQREVGAV